MASKKTKPDYKGELAKPIEMGWLGALARGDHEPELDDWVKKTFQTQKRSKQEGKLQALARHFGVTLSSGLNPVDHEQLKLLLLKVAEKHIKGFQVAQRIGRPLKESLTDDEFATYLSVKQLVLERKLKVHTACKLYVQKLVKADMHKRNHPSVEKVRSLYRRIDGKFGPKGK